MTTVDMNNYDEEDTFNALRRMPIPQMKKELGSFFIKLKSLEITRRKYEKLEDAKTTWAWLIRPSKSSRIQTDERNYETYRAIEIRKAQYLDFVTMTGSGWSFDDVYKQVCKEVSEAEVNVEREDRGKAYFYLCGFAFWIIPGMILLSIFTHPVLFAFICPLFGYFSGTVIGKIAKRKWPYKDWYGLDNYL